MLSNEDLSVPTSQMEWIKYCTIARCVQQCQMVKIIEPRCTHHHIIHMTFNWCEKNNIEYDACMDVIWVLRMFFSPDTPITKLFLRVFLIFHMLSYDAHCILQLQWIDFVSWYKIWWNLHMILFHTPQHGDILIFQRFLCCIIHLHWDQLLILMM